MKKFRVAFFGTPEFAVPSLDLLNHHPSIELPRVVSMPDRPSGRGMEIKSPEVIEYCKSKKIPFFQTANINQESEMISSLEESQLDFIVVLAFAQFLSERVLNIARLGCFNIHTSLLPRYRGAAPIQYALKNGDAITGVSIQKMVKQMDAGDIVHSQKVSISPTETAPQLFTRLKLQAALSLNDFIENLLCGDIQYLAQDESNVSFAPTIKKEDGLLSFKDKTVFEVLNLIRAYNPWPGTFCYLNGKRLKILEAEKYHIKVLPGEARNDLGALIVGCKDSTLRLARVQLEGKKPCSDSELLNGIKSELHLGSTKG